MYKNNYSVLTETEMLSKTKNNQN